MTRRSKREIERAVDDLTDDRGDPNIPFDVREGVSAPFVTFDYPDRDGGVGPHAEFLSFQELKERQERPDE